MLRTVTASSGLFIRIINIRTKVDTKENLHMITPKQQTNKAKLGND